MLDLCSRLCVWVGGRERDRERAGEQVSIKCEWWVVDVFSHEYSMNFNKRKLNLTPLKHVATYMCVYEWV